MDKASRSAEFLRKLEKARKRAELRKTAEEEEQEERERVMGPLRERAFGKRSEFDWPDDPEEDDGN